MIQSDDPNFPQKIEQATIEQLNNEDRQILLSLLQEYSAKLNSLNSQIEERIVFYNNFFLITSLMPVLFLIIIFSTYQFFPYNLYLVIISLFIVGVLFFRLIVRKKTKRRILEKQAEILAIKLERLVRTTSQYQENVEKNYIRKIELDLRLADAESSLSYYYKLNKELNALRGYVLIYKLI
jgi:hypothetical protein